jgi:hypothetical protein
VMVGAVDSGVSRRTEGSSAAAKAAALSPQLDEASTGDGDPDGTDSTTHPVRRVLIALLVLALLGAGGFGVWRWSQQQYYVGAQGKKVAIFRGLSQDVGPLHTSKVYAEQDIALSDLPTYQRDRVRADIAANNLADAKRIVTTLRRQAVLCRSAAARAAANPSPTATASATPTTSATPSPTTSTSTPSTTPSPTAPSTPDDPATADCGGAGS